MRTNSSYIRLYSMVAALAIVMLLVTASHAQDFMTGAFEGLVVDEVTGDPIKGASVTFFNDLSGFVITKVTDKKGRFFQDLLLPGVYEIQFSASGYKSRRVRQRLFFDRQDTLVPSPIELDPIESPAKLQAQPGITGSLAVASVSNAMITVEALDGSPSHKNVIPPDQLLCIFDNLSPKSYRVGASLEGYQSAKTKVVISANKTLPLTLSLLPNESSTQIITNAGRYYALVIGIDNYQHLPHLKTAEADAIAVDSILRERFGFETKLLLKANREQIIVALNEYRRKIEPTANLLIYYAGHGYNDAEVEKAYWLPVNARREDNANWISADDITINVKGLPAKHVLIVSDSCYSGTISRATELRRSEPVLRERYLQKMSNGRSRTLMASGGNEPVADSGGGSHSVFAAALLTGLSQMDTDIFAAEEIFYNFIRQVVTGKSNQTPEYNPIRNSGHESGDFVFVRKKL